MAQTDELDVFGDPIIDLPEDIGDGWNGQYLTMPNSKLVDGRSAAISSRHDQRQPFRDTLMTDNWAMGPSTFISLGRPHVSDSIRPRQFRRVHQIFRHMPSRDLDETGTFAIRFWGAGIAVARQQTHALVSGSGAFANAMLALDDGALIPYPTQYAAATTFTIRLRMPGYEPQPGNIVAPASGCFDHNSGYAKSILRANSIEEFTFGNRISEMKQIEIPYPAGRSIPVTFDIVNDGPAAILVDFFVEILINRTEQNNRNRGR